MSINQMIKLILTAFSRKVSYQLMEESLGFRGVIELVYILRNDIFL
jgi:hypothetical protein